MQQYFVFFMQVPMHLVLSLPVSVQRDYASGPILHLALEAVFARLFSMGATIESAC